MPPSFGSFEIVDFYAELSRIEWLCFRPRQVSRRASKRKMKLLSSDPDGSILTAKRPSVKSIWTLCAPFAKHPRISFSCSLSKSLMNSSREYRGRSSPGYIRLRAEGEMMACLAVTFKYFTCQFRKSLSEI